MDGVLALSLASFILTIIVRVSDVLSHILHWPIYRSTSCFSYSCLRSYLFKESVMSETLIRSKGYSKGSENWIMKFSRYILISSFYLCSRFRF